MQISASKHGTWMLFVVLLVALYCPLFLHLDYMPLRQWDESILGVNTLEMMQNHNYIVTYQYGEPDNSNCKPPLAIWLMGFFSKMLGFSELSLRLPSALAALALCIFLFWGLKKYTGSAPYAMCVILVLITCRGYVRNHVIRTGEYDSLLVLFSTAAAFHLFLYTEATEAGRKSRLIFTFFIFLTLAILTKGVACLMQAPGLLIYVLMRKQFLTVLKDKGFYAGLAIFLFIGLGYYFLREHLSPGYLQAVWEQELGGRYGRSNDGHAGANGFYVNELFEWQFTSYLFILPIAILIGLFLSDTLVKRVTIFALVTGGFFLLVISNAKTKLPHYDAPLFPYLAIITAGFFYFLYNAVFSFVQLKLKGFVAYLVSMVFLLALFAKTYGDIIDVVYFPKGDSWEESFSVDCRYYQMAVRHEIDVDHEILVFGTDIDYGMRNPITCYQYQLKEQGLYTNAVKFDEVKPHQRVVVFDPWIRTLLERKYEITYLRRIEKCKADVLMVNDTKTQEN